MSTLLVFLVWLLRCCTSAYATYTYSVVPSAPHYVPSDAHYVNRVQIAIRFCMSNAPFVGNLRWYRAPSTIIPLCLRVAPTLFVNTSSTPLYWQNNMSTCIACAFHCVAPTLFRFYLSASESHHIVRCTSSSVLAFLFPRVAPTLLHFCLCNLHIQCRTFSCTLCKHGAHCNTLLHVLLTLR